MLTNQTFATLLETNNILQTKQCKTSKIQLSLPNQTIAKLLETNNICQTKVFQNFLQNICNDVNCQCLLKTKLLQILKTVGTYTNQSVANHLKTSTTFPGTRSSASVSPWSTPIMVEPSAI